MISRDPGRRPTACEVIQHNFGLSGTVSGIGFTNSTHILFWDDNEIVIKTERNTAVKIGGIDVNRCDSDRASQRFQSQYIVKKYRFWLECSNDLVWKLGKKSYPPFLISGQYYCLQ